jgi:menaquinone-specific isochorismate synthase
MTVTPYRHPASKAPQPPLKTRYQSTLQATLATPVLNSPGSSDQLSAQLIALADNIALADKIALALQNQDPVISVAIACAKIDPLQVLQTLGRSDQPSFYFEKQDFHCSGYAVELTQPSDYSLIALEAALIYTAQPGQTKQFKQAKRFKQARFEQARFEQAKRFIQTTLQQSTLLGEAHKDFAGPHFFCNFTFSGLTEKTCFPAARVVLPKWQVSQQGNSSYVTANFVPDYSSNPVAADLLQEFAQFLTQLPWQEPGQSSCELPDYSHTPSLAQPQQFTQAVQRALGAIAAGDLDKIVLAHPLDVTLPESFDLAAALRRLRHHYPDCYRFLASNGQGQHFIGASPERLVSLDQQQLRADTLAGSAPRGSSPHEDAALAQQLLQSPKEGHEHQLVLEFITTALHQLQLIPHSAERGLLQLSNIQHLHTPIAAQVPADLHLLDIVAQLHPTPAVAGLCRQSQSRELACKLIRRWEGFERSLYAAPIGWVDHQGNGEFAVGIRSALIDGNSARLFAGAGIVAGSDPQQELAEVNLKLQALLSVLV